jgi:hypothetical protein
MTGWGITSLVLGCIRITFLLVGLTLSMNRRIAIVAVRSSKQIMMRNVLVELPEDVMLRLVKLAKQEQFTVHEMAADILIAHLT